MTGDDIKKLKELEFNFYLDCCVVRDALSGIIDNKSICNAKNFYIDGDLVRWKGGKDNMFFAYDELLTGAFPLRLVELSEKELEEYVKSENEKIIAKKLEDEKKLAKFRLENKRRELESKQKQYESLGIEIEQIKKELSSEDDNN